MVEKMEHELIAHNHHISKRYSVHKGFFSSYLPEAELQDFRNIVVFGGDGTMHEVLNDAKKG